MKKLIILFGLMFLAVAAYGQNNFRYPIIVGLNGGTGGYIKLNGATSGSATIQVAAVAGTTTFQYPTTNGTNGYVLTTNGAGVLSWAATGSSMNYPSGSGIPLAVSGASWGTTITNNSANWNTAYGWGDWSTAVGLRVSKSDSSDVARANSYATGKMIGDVKTQIDNTTTLGVDTDLFTIGDTTVTAKVGRIVFKTSDTHWYGCRKLTAKKWYQIVLLGD